MAHSQMWCNYLQKYSTKLDIVNFENMPSDLEIGGLLFTIRSSHHGSLLAKFSIFLDDLNSSSHAPANDPANENG